MLDERPTFVYDGDCGFCQRSVAFYAARDPEKRLRYSSNLVEPLILESPDRVAQSKREVILFQNENVYGGSEAAIRAWLVIRPKSILKIFLKKPLTYVAEGCYRLVAKNRLFISRLLKIPATCGIQPKAK